MTAKGLSEHRTLHVIGMSASALRYQPRPDRNGALRGRIVALAQRHRRYGASMIYLKLRQAGEWVNHKRVERLYTLEKTSRPAVSAQENPGRRTAATDPPWCRKRSVVGRLCVRPNRLGTHAEVPDSRG